MTDTLPKPRSDLHKLLKRSDYLAARSGSYAAGAFCRVQMRQRQADMPSRIGITVTKKNGNAVIRNRIKRRLRDAARNLVPGSPKAGCDCVIIAKRGALDAPFDALQADLATAISKAEHRLTGGESETTKTKRVP